MGHDVTEYDPQVKEMLERHVPLRLDAQSDWAGAVHRPQANESLIAVGRTPCTVGWRNGLPCVVEAAACSRLHSASPCS